VCVCVCVCVIRYITQEFGDLTVRAGGTEGQPLARSSASYDHEPCNIIIMHKLSYL